MSHKRQKKYSSSDCSDCSETERSEEHCNTGNCYNQSQACIVCPPCDYIEKYESSLTDNSCPDFSDLCEDKPKICCEKKQLCKKNKPCPSSCEESSNVPKCHKKSFCEKNIYKSSSASSEISDSSRYMEKKKSGCNGCNKRCNKCAQCNNCGCNECSDTSQVSALGYSDSSVGCPNFDDIACDKKKRCQKLVSPCKEKKRCQKYVSPCEEKKRCQKYVSPCEEKKRDHCLPANESSGLSKGKKFIVTFESKQGHPWSEYNEGSDSIHINGKNGPVLHLYRGCTYFFCVEQLIPDGADPQHALILTNSPVGGPTSRVIPNSFPPVPQGCVCFKVDKNTPRYFFYQDFKNELAGGLVIVHDK